MLPDRRHTLRCRALNCSGGKNPAVRCAGENPAARCAAAGTLQIVAEEGVADRVVNEVPGVLRHHFIMLPNYP